MYAVDITRCGIFDSNDMLFGKNSIDAKAKTIKYISDYAFANYNINIDKNILDRCLDMNSFSLKSFLSSNYDISIKNDLLIQSLYTDKDKSLFVKFFDRSKNDMPNVYAFKQKEEKRASALLSFLINDSLIKKYEDNLMEYEKNKVSSTIISYSTRGLEGEVISLNGKNMVLDELLNNDYSLGNKLYAEDIKL